MTVNASKSPYNLDAGSTVVLRDEANGAETSTATSTPVKLNNLAGPYWKDTGDLAGVVLVIDVFVESINTNDGDETYLIEIQVDDTAGHTNNPLTVASVSPVSIGSYRLGVDLATVAQLLPGVSDRWIAAKVTIAGASPSINFGARISGTR